MPPPAGVVAVTVEPETVNDKGTMCWSMSRVWVTEPRSTMLTAEIEPASGLVIDSGAPYPAEAGAEVIVGRAPLNKYAGE